MSVHGLRRKGGRLAGLGLAVIALCAPGAWAQSVANGNIRGTVTDPSGAALPGVTVTAKSPALLVPEVTAVTDPAGEYKLADLPVGEYRVSYQLTGFQQLVRENVILTAGFNATLDVALKVGNVNESLTVTGEGPVVDMNRTTPSVTLSTKTLTEVLPATRNVVELLSTTPGAIRNTRPDLGGGTSGGGDFSAYGILGQETILMDGVNTHQSVITQGTGFGPDMGSMEEVQVTALGGGAELPTPGIALNFVVKSGGNQFHGRVEAQGETHKLQGDNLSPALQAQGLGIPDAIRSFQEYSADLGGPIVRNKLWFYSALRYQRGDRSAAGFAADPGADGTYNTADDVAGHRQAVLKNYTLKATYQASSKYKVIGLYTMHTENFDPYPDVTDARFNPLEHSRIFHWDPHEWKVEVQGTPSSRFVFNALFGFHDYLAQYTSQPDTVAGPSTFDNVSLLNLGPNLAQDIRPRRSFGPSVTMSYFPEGSFLGKHELKAGLNHYWQWSGTGEPDLSPYNYLLTFGTVNGVPHQGIQMTTYNYPLAPRSHQDESGVFLQDSWRPTRRLTVNLGLRVDRYSTFLPPQCKEAGQFSTAGCFPRIDTGSWTELAPRLSLAYNLFGNNKTVLRASFGRYNHGFGDDFATTYNRNAITTTRYTWHDLNNDGQYQTGEVNLDPNGGDFLTTTGAANNILNPNLRDPRTMETAVALEREVLPNLSARVSFTHIRQADLYGAYNILNPSANYNVPIVRQDPGPDGRLGTGDDGGNVTVFDYPAQFRGSNFVGNQLTNSSEPFTFKVLEAVVTKRATGRWSLLGSFSAIKNHALLAAAVAPFSIVPASPNQEAFNVNDTWSWQGKLSGSYDLPWTLRVSGSFELYNGVRGQRSYVFMAIPSQSTVPIRLEPFGSETGPVRSLLNLRLAKELPLGGAKRLRLVVDVLNALNTNAPWAINYVSGPAFGQYTILTPPRVARGGVTFNF